MRSAFVKILLALFGFAVPFGDFVPAARKNAPSMKPTMILALRQIQRLVPGRNKT